MTHVGIVGGSGFLGTALYEKLLKTTDHNVTIFDVKRPAEVPEHHYVFVDVTNPKTLMHVFDNVDVLFYRVGLMGPARSFDNPIRYHHVNLEGCLNVLEACVEANVKAFALDSTESVFGPQDDGPFTEEDLPHPASIYGSTKAMCEHYTKYVAIYEGIKVCIFRYPRIISTINENIITRMASRLQSGDEITVMAGGAKTFDLVHLHDVIRWNCWYIDACGNYFTLHVSPGFKVSVTDIIESLADQLGINSESHPIRHRADYSDNERLLPDCCVLESKASQNCTGLGFEYDKLETFVQEYDTDRNRRIT